MKIPQGWSVVKQGLITVAYLDHGPEDGYEWQAWLGDMDASALIEECRGDTLPESLDLLVLADIKRNQIDGFDDAYDVEPQGRPMPPSYFDSADRRTGGL